MVELAGLRGHDVRPHRVILRKSLASERCDRFRVTHVQFLMPTTTTGVVGIHTMLGARF